MTSPRSRPSGGSSLGPAVSEQRVGGVRTRVIETQGSGPVILLLHGFADSAETWLELMEHLAAGGHRAVAVDLPGYGESGRGSESASLSDLVAFVIAAVAHWTEAGQPPVVVGNSLGALCGVLASQHPAAVMSALVPISPPGFGHTAVINLLERYAWLNPLMFQPVVPMPLFRRIVGGGVRVLAGGGTTVSRRHAATFREQFRTSEDVHRLFAVLPGLLAQIKEAVPGLESVRPRTLVIWGRHDRLTVVAGAERLGRLPVSGDVVVLPDCGHCPQLQQPELVAQLISDLVADLAPTRGIGSGGL